MKVMIKNIAKRLFCGICALVLLSFSLLSCGGNGCFSAFDKDDGFIGFDDFDDLASLKKGDDGVKLPSEKDFIYPKNFPLVKGKDTPLDSHDSFKATLILRVLSKGAGNIYCALNDSPYVNYIVAGELDGNKVFENHLYLCEATVYRMKTDTEKYGKAFGEFFVIMGSSTEKVMEISEEQALALLSGSEIPEK